eukprot:CAMPEP_0180254974 /NCGR_PEP_ID=MMETSP0987-20121128/40466_1 /TAXON_ID=697907 /ORGANISM="non described non described, Strain CCMP2293" /LENGTH=128 /DNA_ID=CAMNT_0022224037 /DNA_START=129 /DNA_END=512 /DNA_ORIENTATION=-
MSCTRKWWGLAQEEDSASAGRAAQHCGALLRAGDHGTRSRPPDLGRPGVLARRLGTLDPRPGAGLPLRAHRAEAGAGVHDIPLDGVDVELDLTLSISTRSILASNGATVQIFLSHNRDARRTARASLP